MANNDMMKTVFVVGSLLALFASGMYVVETGFAETVNVIQGDDGNVSNNTSLALGNTGGGVDFLDQLLVITMVGTILISLGVISRSRGNPDVINWYISYLPVVGALISIAVYWDVVQDILMGKHTWGAVSDLQDSIHLAATGWFMAGTAKLMAERNQ